MSAYLDGCPLRPLRPLRRHLPKGHAVPQMRRFKVSKILYVFHCRIWERTGGGARNDIKAAQV
jgi:hypothetical protein